MTSLWTGQQRPSGKPADLEHVRRCSESAGDPLDGLELYARNGQPRELRWIALLLMIGISIVACGLATIAVQIARHWVGLTQIAFVWLVLTLLTLGVDRVLAPAWFRVQAWFR